MSAYDQASIAINRCKRILALVDTYVEKQTSATRTDLRKALLAEFDAAASAPPVAAATPGGLVFINDGAEPASSELDCPACGGSGHAGDVPAGSAP